ncbi:hypothetical protein [Arthrobacter mobilis]|uniref:Uncharacterized protein n=1 Tax=Arthrobacter mobilis TaxID=2724944 RepID=A0A7X6HA88_9MICC|nr:hypothetical protein [Arthrobacter mobilis]NKX53344.1 hypothetical protein [Arthrobacter mobilis]
MSHPHRPAREPEPTEAFAGTAPMEVDQYPGSEAAAEEHPEDAPGAGSAAVPPRSMEDIAHVTVAELLRRQNEPGR